MLRNYAHLTSVADSVRFGYLVSWYLLKWLHVAVTASFSMIYSIGFSYNYIFRMVCRTFTPLQLHVCNHPPRFRLYAMAARFALMLWPRRLGVMVINFGYTVYSTVTMHSCAGRPKDQGGACAIVDVHAAGKKFCMYVITGVA